MDYADYANIFIDAHHCIRGFILCDLARWLPKQEISWSDEVSAIARLPAVAYKTYSLLTPRRQTKFHPLSHPPTDQSAH